MLSWKPWKVGWKEVPDREVCEPSLPCKAVRRGQAPNVRCGNTHIGSLSLFLSLHLLRVGSGGGVVPPCLSYNWGELASSSFSRDQICTILKKKSCDLLTALNAEFKGALLFLYLMSGLQQAVGFLGHRGSSHAFLWGMTTVG